MDLCCRARAAETLALLVVLVSLGCSDAVKLTHETDNGGAVTYSYKSEEGPMFSPYRSQALEAIQKKCPGGYTIVREGQARPSGTSSGLMEGTEDEARHRRWGVEFRCKG